MVKNTDINMPQGWEMKDSFEKVVLNRYGYYELRRKNTQGERKKNFEDEYFQNYSGATYMKEYSDEELAFTMNKIEERAYVIEQNLVKQENLKEGKYSLLDIGCGEGFLLKYFHDRGIRVKGVDIGSYALKHFHPEMLPYLVQGDIETVIPEMKKQGECFDVVNMDRILDMVLEADKCIEMIKGLMTEKSVLVIKVANNYSYLQQMLMRSGEVKEEYWLDDPDHTGYFNREGLINLLNAEGFECIDFYGDTFVDFHLLNSLTNYYEKPETGKAAHKAMVRLENLIHEISMERTVEIYRMLGDMGFGREIVGIFRKRAV